MGQTMQLNQFSQTPIKGDSATKVNLNTLSVQIDPDSVATLQPCDAVKLSSGAGAPILVDKCAASDEPFGFIFYSLKKDLFTAGDTVEIGLFSSIIYAEAGGTISRGDDLEYVPSAVLATGPKMIASLGSNPISALSLDEASSGDIFRMIVIGQASVTATISGGTINNTPIGQTTASLGRFTVLQATTSLTVSGNTTTTTTYDAISALTPGTTISLDPTLGGMFTLTPAQSCTINAASVPAKHQTIVLVVTTSGTSPFTITFGSNFKSTGTLSTGASSGKVFVVVFEGNGTNFNEASRTIAM